MFLHEHIIYCSDYFIKKLRLATHWYIDGTFVVPPNFKQLIVILYREDFSGKRYPGLYCLINNKKRPGYINIFKKILSLITLEYTKDLHLITYSIDFEKALIDSLKELLPDKRCVGCYYHYCRNLYNKAKQMGILKEEIFRETEKLLNCLYQLPYKYNDMNKLEFENEITKFDRKDNLFLDYINYFKMTWIPFFLNGMLNYAYLTKEQRSNSYLENYNRIIKEKLSNYLYGKINDVLLGHYFFIL